MFNFSCAECGATLRRSRRRLSDRFWYLAAYRCQGCGARYQLSVASRVQLARWAKCPRCRQQNIRAIRRIDPIDFKRGGVLNFFHKVCGGQLYHCWLCRLQFYDFRPRNSPSAAKAPTD